jgi:hypothetical protein
MSDALAPAKRASVLMFVLAGVSIVGAFCCAGVGTVLPQLLDSQPQMLQEFQKVPGFTPDLMRTTFIVMGIGAAIFGTALAILGVFVRKGGAVPVTIALVLSCLATLFVLYLMIEPMVLRRAPAGSTAAGVCMLAIPFALLILLCVWLLQALRSSGQVQAMKDQYAQQYWQYAYQQQIYAQQQPPPPPPPGDPNAPPPQG